MIFRLNFWKNTPRIYYFFSLFLLLPAVPAIFLVVHNIRNLSATGQLGHGVGSRDSFCIGQNRLKEGVPSAALSPVERQAPIRDLACHRDRIYLATDSGLFIAPNRSPWLFQKFGPGEGLQDSPIRELHLALQGLIIRYQNGSLSLLRGQNEILHYRLVEEGIRQVQVFKNLVLLASRDHLYRWDGNTLVRVTQDPLPGISCFFYDGWRAWVGTENSGIHVFEPEGRRHFPLTKVIARKVHRISALSGKILFSTPSGLYRLDPEGEGEVFSIAEGDNVHSFVRLDTGFLLESDRGILEKRGENPFSPIQFPGQFTKIIPGNEENETLILGSGKVFGCANGTRGLEVRYEL